MADQKQVEIRCLIPKERYKALVYQAERLGFPVASLVKNGLHDYIEVLETKELEEKRRKEERKKSSFDSLIPSLPGFKGRVPEQRESKFSSEAMDKKRAEDKVVTALKAEVAAMTKATATNPKGAVDKVPDKIKKSFKRWAEYMEAAEDRSDAKVRAADVMKDITERCQSEEQAEAYYEAFQAFLETRREAKLAVVDVKNVVGDV